MPVRYEQGSNPLLYWPGLAVFAGRRAGACRSCACAGCRRDAWAGAAFVAAFLLFFLWQARQFLSPQPAAAVYRPERLPAELMPTADNAAILVAHHQHRALGVAHDMAGIGAEEIGAHRRAGANSSRSGRRRSPSPLPAPRDRCRLGGPCSRYCAGVEPAFARDDRQRLLRRFALLHVEIRRHVFRQHHRRHRQHIDQPHRAAGGALPC